MLLNEVSLCFWIYVIDFIKIISIYILNTQK